MTDPTNPLIVQADLSVLVEVASPRYEEAREALARFAELETSPEHIHTYRISPLSLWNAAASGESAGDVAATLTRLAKYPVAPSVLTEVHDQMSRFGRLRHRGRSRHRRTGAGDRRDRPARRGDPPSLGGALGR
ncbi:MAG: helicase-associated domain-containing protein [Acidimicrobiales bacterium]